MYAPDEEKRPVDGEAQDVGRAVEVVGLLDADGKRPVEGREVGRRVAGRFGAVGPLDEAA
jgi:hypothetical protein